MPAKEPGDRGRGPRFLTIADVAEILATSPAQVRALIRDNQLRYIQIGGRNQYRIEVAELENYIQRQYAKTDQRSADESRQPGSSQF
jgi:excisionase family DNA binding protein